MEHVSTSQIGYLCHAPKIAVVRGVTSGSFAVQVMSRMGAAPLGAAASTYEIVHHGTIQRVQSVLGEYGLCDFSGVTQPGVYQVILPDSGAKSYQFTVADGVYHRLPYLFLDFMHGWRSGYYADDLRSPLHLDDGVRSDNGQAWDAVGGWYDAGDFRKWMGHSTLPALGMLEVQEHLTLQRRSFEPIGVLPTDWLTEAAWGIPFILKMQDPQSGMIYEDVGGGHTSRWREGMTWWYENHAGCYADNADNRFTDNLTNTGDERLVRIQYNPIAQYTNIAILARAFVAYAPHDAALSQMAYRGALAAWRFCATRLDDAEHGWTAVRSWRVCATLELYRAGLLTISEVETAVGQLLENFDPRLGFWINSAGNPEPYRAILHSAQPLIALAKTLDYLPNSAHTAAIHSTLATCKARYIDELSATTPYRFMPFGVYTAAITPDDLYRTWRDGYLFRLCMPVNHPQQVNHGLAGHWMSWAHGLAYVGQVLADPSWTALAWAQIEWVTGNNDYDVSFITGVGYNNPMPHSRYLGTVLGGFMNGFRGSVPDIPSVDLAREAEWNSTEYWNVPLSNCLMALARLLPRTVANERKLGAV